MGDAVEVAGIGALGAILMVVTLYKCYRKEDLGAILSGTVRESTMIMMIIATSFLFTYVMSYLGITQAGAQWLVSMGFGKWEFVLWSSVFMVVLGFFLPPVAIILMVTPIILPSLKALQIDLVWYGIIMTILMEMGLIHPPVGLNLFVIQGIAPQIKLRNIIWGTCRSSSSWCWASSSLLVPTSRCGCPTTSTRAPDAAPFRPHGKCA
jgi:TRAP-type C4-dicarboxylate transport system permease large subunit